MPRSLPPQPLPYGRGVAAILLTAVLWGTTGTAMTFVDAGPLAVGALGLGGGALLLALTSARAVARERDVLVARAGLVLLGAASVVVYPLAFYSSMHVGGVAVGTVVSLASAPLASGVVERVVDRRRLGSRWLGAAGLGIGGSTLLCLAGAHGSGTAGGVGAAGMVAAVALGLVAGTTYAIYSWVAHRLMAGGVGRGAAMGSVFGLGALVLVPLGMLVVPTSALDTAASTGALAYLALVPMFLGYVLFGLGLSAVRPSTATTLTLAEPAVATVLAVLVVGERLGVLGWCGMALLGVGLVLSAGAGKRLGKNLDKRNEACLMGS